MVVDFRGACFNEKKYFIFKKKMTSLTQNRITLPTTGASVEIIQTELLPNNFII
jgi:hypothetical protein